MDKKEGPVNIVHRLRACWEKEQKAHDKDYVFGWQWGHDYILRQIQQTVGNLIHGKVLEIGCGGGKWTKWLFKFADEVHAMDVHKTAIEESSKYEPRAHYKLCNGEDLNWPDDSFDIVFTWDVFLHLPMLLVQRYFDESRRVLKPGGLLIFALPDLKSESGKRNFVAAVKGKRWRRPYNRGYMSYYTKQQISTMLFIAGFDHVTHLAHAGSSKPREIVFSARK